MIKVRSKERLWTGTLVGFALLYVAASLRMEQRPLPGVPSAAAVPLGLGVLLLALLGWVVVRGTRHVAVPDSRAASAPPEQHKEDARARPELVLALAVAYAFALGWIGFPLATTGYMLSSMYYLKPQRVRPAAVGLWAVAVTAIFWMVFVCALKLQLPTARLWG